MAQFAAKMVATYATRQTMPSRHRTRSSKEKPLAAKTDIMTKLGNPDAVADRNLETFALAPGVTRVRLDCREFTCRCPITGQPDWATIEVEYVPNGRAVESKSMKLYLETFREEGIFHEALADVIAGDVHDATGAHHVRVTVHFNVRGGIALDATAERGVTP